MHRGGGLKYNGWNECEIEWRMDKWVNRFCLNRWMDRRMDAWVGH